MTDLVGRYKATPEMAEAYENGISDAVNHFQTLVRKGNELREISKRPRPTEGVQNGAILLLSNLCNSYFFAAQAFVLSLPDEQGQNWFPWMVLRNHHARGAMGLPGWMQYLIDKNGGVIPETWSNADVKSDAVIAEEKAA